MACASVRLAASSGRTASSKKSRTFSYALRGGGTMASRFSRTRLILAWMKLPKPTASARLASSFMLTAKMRASSIELPISFRISSSIAAGFGLACSSSMKSPLGIGIQKTEKMGAVIEVVMRHEVGHGTVLEELEAPALADAWRHCNVATIICWQHKIVGPSLELGRFGRAEPLSYGFIINHPFPRVDYCPEVHRAGVSAGRMIRA